MRPLRSVDGAELIPVDSEHCAIHQCLRGSSSNETYRHLAKLVLTASGGPFRGLKADELSAVTVDEALAHPTWSMGPKITVDSSTLMNKGLEVIEAHELFGVASRKQSYGWLNCCKEASSTTEIFRTNVAKEFF